MVQKPLAARATRGRPDHLRSVTGRKQERERYEQTQIKSGKTLTRENWGRKRNTETCEGGKRQEKETKEDFLIFQFNEAWTWFYIVLIGKKN